MTAVLTLLFLLANLSTWLLIFVGSLLDKWPLLSGLHLGSFLSPLVLVLSNVPIFLLHLVIYRFVPGRGIATRAALLGAGVASVIWWISGLGFGWYLASFASYGSLYGTYAFLIVFLLWIYYSSIALMVGALVCQECRIHDAKAAH